MPPIVRPIISYFKDICYRATYERATDGGSGKRRKDGVCMYPGRPAKPDDDDTDVEKSVARWPADVEGADAGACTSLRVSAS